MTSSKSNTWLSVLPAHLILVTIICILPEMLMGYAAAGRMGATSTPWWFYAKSALMIAVFYLNYYFIIERTVVRRHNWWSFTIINIVLVVATVMLMWVLNEIGHNWEPRHARPIPHDGDVVHHILMSASFMMRDAIVLLLAIVLAVVLRLSQRWKDMERHRAQLADEHRAAELNSLRSQLNPHFLFNTLNSIYALIEISPTDARSAVHDLSNMLRYVVYENPERVDLQREVDFINNYVDLMRLRLGDRPIKVDINIPAGVAVTVPPLIFVSLIDNAFKYGNTTRHSDPIEISLYVTDTGLQFRTDNVIDREARHEQHSGGVGLVNLRRRLELIYGSRATLSTSSDNGIFTATITIDDPCRSLDA